MNENRKPIIKKPFIILTEDEYLRALKPELNQREKENDKHTNEDSVALEEKDYEIKNRR